MKSVLIFTICAFSTFTFADDNKPKYQTMDLKQFDGVKTNTASNSGITFSSTCKTDDGRELKSSDEGYSNCLMKAGQNQQNKK